MLNYDEQSLVSDDLTLPHADMPSRAFVMIPHAEIAPERVIAGAKVSVVAQLIHPKRQGAFGTIRVR